MTETTPHMNPKRHWTKRLRGFLPEFFEQHTVLSRFHQRASVIFHGSTTMGIDDEHSDLDLWLLLTAADLAKLDAVSETRFFEITVDGKLGHLNADSVEGVSERLRRCDMDLIFQLRNAEIMSDDTGAAEQLIGLARTPMSKRVSEAFFFYHYVEMRGERRACGSPMQRGNPIGLLLAASKAIAHILKAALVLDREPYPYDKWLSYAAAKSTTGQQVLPKIDNVLDLFAGDALRLKAPLRNHPLYCALKDARDVLIQSARAKGLDAPWLTHWWLYMNQAQDEIKGIRWDGLDGE